MPKTPKVQTAAKKNKLKQQDYYRKKGRIISKTIELTDKHQGSSAVLIFISPHGHNTVYFSKPFKSDISEDLMEVLRRNWKDIETETGQKRPLQEENSNVEDESSEASSSEDTNDANK